MHTSPTTLPLVRGRIDTIIDRLDTLYFGSRNATFHQHRVKLDVIRSELATCSSTVPTNLAREMLHQLNSLQRDLPMAYNVAVARGASVDFTHDWSTAFPEICQYITFIANRIPEISSLPPPTAMATSTAATAATTAVPPVTVAHHLRQPSAPAAMGISRTASQPAVAVSRAQAQPPPFIPPADYMRRGGGGPSVVVPTAGPSLSGSRMLSYAAPASVTRGYSMPSLGVPAAATAHANAASYHHTYTAAGPVAVPVPRSPGSMYPAAPVPSHLAHVYARSPVLGARY